MKFLVFIISFFLLGQSFSYCQDDSLTIDASRVHCGEHDDTDTDGDPCSSVCACSCCLVVSFSETETIISEPLFDISERERFDYIEPGLKNRFISGVLQPPQIA